jgi:hypothetical protein
MGERKIQASDREEQEAGKRWGRETARQASEWGRARDRQVMMKSKRQVSDG